MLLMNGQRRFGGRSRDPWTRATRLLRERKRSRRAWHEALGAAASWRWVNPADYSLVISEDPAKPEHHY